MNIKYASFAGFIGLTVFAGLATSTEAVAAEGNDTYAATDKGWIHNASPFPYATGARPSSTIDSKTDGFSALYFLPDGRGPDTGQTDLTLSYLAPITLTGEPTAEGSIETIDFNFASFGQLEAQLGTRFIDAQTITADPKHAQAPDVELYGSLLTVVRPACKSPLDPRNYDIQVALLGDNGYRYSAEIDVTFGKRPLKGCTAAVSTSKPEPTKAPATATPQPTLEASKPAKAVENQPVTKEAASPKENASNGEEINWAPILIAGGLLTVIVLIITFKVRRSRARRFNEDGSIAGDLNEPKTGPRGTESIERFFAEKPDSNGD
jgi:hypothetical protein